VAVGTVVPGGAVVAAGAVSPAEVRAAFEAANRPTKTERTAARSAIIFFTLVSYAGYTCIEHATHGALLQLE
jgi:hypothetical protein